MSARTARPCPVRLLSPGDLAVLPGLDRAVLVDAVDERSGRVRWHDVDGDLDAVARGTLLVDLDADALLLLTASQLNPPAVPAATVRRVRQIREARA